MSEVDERVARLEDELRAATKAREVLLASVAHDLRNPLNTFAMSNGLLRDDVEREDIDPKRALAMITRMDRAVVRMQHLIEDLLEASRIEAKKIDFAKKPNDVSAILSEVQTSAKLFAADKSASIALGTTEPSMSVLVDRDRLSQAIGKLIAFSLKAIGEGGVIQLSAARAGEDAEIAIRAIPPGKNAISSPHEEGRGGLSLLIGRSLVEAHGGRIRLEMSADGHAQIIVSLPLAA